MGPVDHSEMPKGWSSKAGFVSALRQRLRPWGEVRLQCPSKARGVCSGWQGLGRGRSGAIQFCPAYPVGSVWRCRGVAGSIASGPKERSKMPRAGHLWREVCLPCCNAVALGVRCVLAQPRATGVCPRSGFCPERGSSGRWHFVYAKGCGVGLVGVVCRLIKIVIPGAAPTRNPCPVERGWIPAVAGMTIRSGVPCQRSEARLAGRSYRGVLSVIRHSRLRFWHLTRQCHDQSRAHKNAGADPIFQTGFRYRPGRQGIRPDAPEVS